MYLYFIFDNVDNFSLLLFSWYRTTDMYKTGAIIKCMFTNVCHTSGAFQKFAEFTVGTIF